MDRFKEITVKKCAKVFLVLGAQKNLLQYHIHKNLFLKQFKSIVTKQKCIDYIEKLP